MTGWVKILRALPFALAAGVVAIAIACTSSNPRCYDGEYVACSCDTGPQGYAKCAAEEYGPCDCSGLIPGTDAASPDAAKPAPACDVTCPFGAACVSNGDCASNVCASYDKLGFRCTFNCKKAEDCPPESNRCGGRGVCQIPQ